MDITQFRYSSDNLGYLIYNNSTAMVVDGGATEEIIEFMDKNGLNLEYVTNTHNHMDHTVGNNEILKNSNALFLDFESLLKKRSVPIGDQVINVYHTPGHTRDSVVFHFDNILITGDTLFIGKVGRCFSNDLRGFLQSIGFIMKLPDETIIYPGHDYVEEYMDFVKKLEPDNEDIDGVLARYNPGHVYSTLKEEKKIDPFLRINEGKIISILKEKGLRTDTEFERWKSIMSLM